MVDKLIRRSIKRHEKGHPFRCPLASDRRGSNPRSRPWQGRALPTTPLSLIAPATMDNIHYPAQIVNSIFMIGRSLFDPRIVFQEIDRSLVFRMIENFFRRSFFCDHSVVHKNDLV